GSAALGLAGAVTANHVLYNFVGQNSTLNAGSSNVLNGTMLAPTGSVNLKGATVNGGVIAGGMQVTLGSRTQVNQGSFQPPVAQANDSISGVVFETDTGLPFSACVIELTGTDSLGHSVDLTTTPDDVTGSYSFTDLLPGTYKLTITIPSGQSSTGQAGTVNG